MIFVFQQPQTRIWNAKIYLAQIEFYLGVSSWRLSRILFAPKIT